MTNTESIQPTIYPSLFYRDAATAIDWLCAAFGFRKRLVVTGDNGSILHSELSYGDGVVMVGSARASAGWISPLDLPGVASVLSVRVEDPDAHYANAVAHGAEITRELRDEEFGSRGYIARDLEGHEWCFATYRPGGHWEDQGGE